jgi:26S proteasome non-ATPase regulatory subunit 9
MDDIHTPSVASSRRTNGVAASSKPKTLTELTAEKDRIESELSALSSVLDSVWIRSNGKNTGLIPGSIAWRQYEYNSYNL